MSTEPPVEYVPDVVLLIGIPATGKSSFAHELLGHSHLRISRDVLRTRHREWQLFEAALGVTARIVIDNTSVTRSERARFIAAARASRYSVKGYFFQSRKSDALERNATRADHLRVPDAAIGGKSAELELPEISEGFDTLHFVRIEGGEFVVEEWHT